MRIVDFPSPLCSPCFSCFFSWTSLVLPAPCVEVGTLAQGAVVNEFMGHYLLIETTAKRHKCSWYAQSRERIIRYCSIWKKQDSSFAVQKQQRIKKKKRVKKMGLGLSVNHIIFKIHTLTLLKIFLFPVIQQWPRTILFTENTRTVSGCELKCRWRKFMRMLSCWDWVVMPVLFSMWQIMK